MKAVFSLLFLVFSLAGLWAQKPRLVVPIGHTGVINSVAFSPDGKYILTGSLDKTAKLWDLRGRELQTFTGHASDVSSVAFSPDGKTVLTGSEDKTARLWDLSGRELQIFKGHADKVSSVAFSPDGKSVLTGSGDNTAMLWDLQGRQLQTFTGHTFYVYSVAFSPDGKSVLTGSGDNTTKLWDLQGRQLQTFTSHTPSVYSVAFSPDGKSVLTGSWNMAELWDLQGRLLQTFTGHVSYVSSVAFSPDGKSVLTGSGDNTAKLWDLQGRLFQTLTGHASDVYSVAFSPDGKSVMTGSGDKTAKLWDSQGRLLQTFTGRASWVTSVAFSPDGKTVLTGSYDNKAKLWDLQRRRLQTFTGHVLYVSSVAFSPDGKSVLTGSGDKTAKLWDLQGRQLQTFTGHASNVLSVAFSPDGKSVLTGSYDNTAKLWDLQGRQLQAFTDHALYVSSVAFSPDGKSVLTGSWDNTAKLWDLQGHRLQTFTGHASWVTSVAFSPDGKSVLTGSGDNTAILWDLQGRQLQAFTGHASEVSSVAFSPDGKSVLTGSYDNTAMLWNLQGRELQSSKGHAAAVNSVVLSPDGKTALTGSGDNTTKIWDAQTGQNLATLIAIDSTDWVVTTPSGLFDASPGAMKLMHYVVGLDVIELDQLKERYYEPGLLAKIIGFDKGELRNVANLDKVALYPNIEAAIEKDRLNIALTERSGGIGKLSLFINGKEVQEDVNPKRLKNLSLNLNTFSKYYRADADNTLTLRAYNAEGWLKSQAYQLEYQPAAGKPAGTGKTIPHLYALVVGTSNYVGERLDLRFADQDASAMSQALQQTGNALFGAERTSIRLLSSLPAESLAKEGGIASTEISSKTNIQKAFSDLAAQAQPQDVLVVYFSGHGLAYGPAEKEQFYYLTKDIGSEDLSDPVVRDNYTISSNEFTQWLTAIPAQKQVMILDACNAGKVVESLATIAQKNLDPSQIRALDRMKDRTGMFILTGSAADKVSYEASQYGQGLLTYSLLQGMSGLALTDDKRVDVMTLFQYSRDKVPELAKGIGGIQTPVLAFPTDGASFDIGIVNEKVKIPVAQLKPMFIRSSFHDENDGDALELVKALETYFRKITSQGAQAELIYTDVSEYENGYSIRGRYAYMGNGVEVKGSLFKGKTSQGKFVVTGKKSDVQGLVEAIIGKVSGMLK